MTSGSDIENSADGNEPVLHRTLARQLLLLKLSASDAPDNDTWGKLLAEVSTVYNDYDVDRKLLERAMDISSREMRTLNDQLTEQAAKDGMTGLLNRSSLMKELDLNLGRLQHNKSTMLAVLFIDLDGFKLINDGLGHAVGDQLLCTVADRLQNCISSTDLVARLGGDEFIVLAPDLPRKEMGIALAEKIVSALSQTVCLPDVPPVGVGASVGVTTVSRGLETSAQQLLKQADLAMYSAKMNGRNRVVSFNAGLESTTETRCTTTEELRDAIISDQLVLHFQPIVCMAHKRVVAMESLVRWQHPERGIIPPDEFIPLAESSGLIHELTRWVLNESLQAQSTWDPDLLVTVNLSRKDIAHTGTIDLLYELHNKSGINLNNVVLEITESSLATLDNTITEELRALLETGVKFAIDDFGSGYSLLSQLLDLPVQYLKLDRKFIEPIAEHAGAQAVVRAVVELAQTLGLAVIAEGIETAEQSEALSLLACDYGQGYYFSRPTPAPILTRVSCHKCTGASFKADTLPKIVGL